MRVGRYSIINNNTNKLQAIGDMSVVAFYYLLRVGEHTYRTKNSTKKSRKNMTRTRQFRVGDVTFRKNGKVVSDRADMNALLSAAEATMCITN